MMKTVPMEYFVALLYKKKLSYQHLVSSTSRSIPTPRTPEMATVLQQFIPFLVILRQSSTINKERGHGPEVIKLFSCSAQLRMNI